jgi:hypothetical protein
MEILNVNRSYQMLISVGLAKELWEYKAVSLNWGKLNTYVRLKINK